MQLEGEWVLVDLGEVQVEVRDEEKAAAAVEPQELASARELDATAID